jgi:hypothetical protein
MAGTAKAIIANSEKNPEASARIEASLFVGTRLA